jgi:hypothetical protein
VSDVPDLAFVAAAYGVILTAVAVYAISLARRLRAARAAVTPRSDRPESGDDRSA